MTREDWARSWKPWLRGTLLGFPFGALPAGGAEIPTFLSYFLEKMKSTMDCDGSLLDKTLIVWGSPMADPNIHNHRRCPLVLFGHANGGLKGNLHLKAPDGTPMANVMLTLLHQLGLDEMKSFGDSTGEFSLSAPAATA